MKKLILTTTFFALSITAQSQVGVGTTDPKAGLDIKSDKGMLLPRIADHTSLTPVDGTLDANEAGLQVYDTTNNKVMLWTGTAWVTSASSADASKWTNDNANTRVALTNLSDGTTARPAGTEFVIQDDGYVGIGTNSPARNLEIIGGDSFSAPGIQIINTQNLATKYGMLVVGEDHPTLGSNTPGGINFILGKVGSRTLVLHNGKVGINQKDPLYSLHVSGDTFLSGPNLLGYTTVKRDSPIILEIDRTANANVDNLYSFGVSFNTSKGTDGLSINQGTNYNLVYVEETGNVSIGTIDPKAKLDVDGYIIVGSSDTTGDTTPVNGMMRYNSTDGKFQGYGPCTAGSPCADGSTSGNGWINLH